MAEERRELRVGRMEPTPADSEVWLGDVELTSWVAGSEPAFRSRWRWEEDGRELRSDTLAYLLEGAVPARVAPRGVLVHVGEAHGAPAMWAEAAQGGFWPRSLRAPGGWPLGYAYGELSRLTGLTERQIEAVMAGNTVALDDDGERVAYWYDVPPMLGRARMAGMRFNDPDLDGDPQAGAAGRREGGAVGGKSRAFVTGDLHGGSGRDMEKLGRLRWPEGDTLTRDDLLVVCGDFGLVWSDPPSAREAWWLDWLEGRPWTTLFVDGNHENHNLLDAMPESEWHGGRVHVLPGHPHIIHLMRGQVYDMGEHGRWFTFGGAASHDRRWRVPYESWWPREMPSEAEMAEGLANLDACGNKVDYVFTHDVPARYKEAAMFGITDDPDRMGVDGLNRYLDEVDSRVDTGRMRRWYCGHYHGDTILRDERHVLLYDQVVELGGVPDEAPAWW